MFRLKTRSMGDFAKHRECGGFHGRGDEGEGAEDVGELGLGEGVEVGGQLAMVLASCSVWPPGAM